MFGFGKAYNKLKIWYANKIADEMNVGDFNDTFEMSVVFDDYFNYFLKIKFDGINWYTKVDPGQMENLEDYICRYDPACPIKPISTSPFQPIPILCDCSSLNGCSKCNPEKEEYKYLGTESVVDFVPSPLIRLNLDNIPHSTYSVGDWCYDCGCFLCDCKCYGDKE